MVSRGNNTRKNAGRGRDAKRHGKSDRDGDVAMGAPIKGSSGRVGKTPAKPGRKTDAPGRPGTISASTQRNVLKHAGLDAAMREPRRSAGVRGGLVELRITGWDKSRIYSNTDSGVNSLITWLEKKASTRLGSRSRAVTVKKVC